jgi:membrane associated rhomboid family serine protease
MSMFLFALLVMAGAVLYFMTPAERKLYAQMAVDRLRAYVKDVREGNGTLDPLHELMLTRTRWPVVAPLLIAMCVFVWFGSAFSSEPAPQWLITAGANYAPRTTNGEWSRLVSYMFVHAGLLHLLTTVGALLALGVVLERLVGHVAFATVFFASGIVVGAMSLWTMPATTVTFGPSAAVFGLYGLFGAIVVYGYAREPRLPGSTLAVKRLGAGTVPFVLYNLFTDHVTFGNELAGLMVGLVSGLVIARGIIVQKPEFKWSVPMPAIIALVAFSVALPMRGTIDARPAVARIADVETRTASEYAKAVAEFTQGRKPAKALILLIDKTIIPALQADRARIEALRGVPSEQKELVDAAREYFKLRETSWQSRRAGLLLSSNKILRDAETAERAALGKFDRVQEILGADAPAATSAPAPAVKAAG